MSEDAAGQGSESKVTVVLALAVNLAIAIMKAVAGIITARWTCIRGGSFRRGRAGTEGGRGAARARRATGGSGLGPGDAELEAPRTPARDPTAGRQHEGGHPPGP